ncbi:hypothetical protein L1987_53040 [Smallanthus sonchifolius]|uniref:Uncharacterized protein n=1 Tax=Smallanthus sonchifolius TaxID=185202 RepID=A0ACB9EVK5_9ASTR|nr:hypothetical protein L1987_53040 [Smallanthus sonchifolius]
MEVQESQGIEDDSGFVPPTPRNRRWSTYSMEAVDDVLQDATCIIYQPFLYLSAVGCSCRPSAFVCPEGDDIFCWKGTVSGSKDTIFQGTEYKISFWFPNDYPFKPPKVNFETGCFHHNVDVFGNICLDILQDKWSSTYDVRNILIFIRSLLGGLKDFGDGELER